MSKLIGSKEDYGKFVEVLFKPLHIIIALTLAYGFMQFDQWYVSGIAIPAISLVLISIVCVVLDVIEWRAFRVGSFLSHLRTEYDRKLVWFLLVMWIMCLPVVPVIPKMLAESNELSSGMALMLFGILLLPPIRFLLFSKSSD
jgi:hypothetical protein